MSGKLSLPQVQEKIDKLKADRETYSRNVARSEARLAELSRSRDKLLGQLKTIGIDDPEQIDSYLANLEVRAKTLSAEIIAALPDRYRTDG